MCVTTKTRHLDRLGQLFEFEQSMCVLPVPRLSLTAQRTAMQAAPCTSARERLRLRAHSRGCLGGSFANAHSWRPLTGAAAPAGLPLQHLPHLNPKVARAWYDAVAALSASLIAWVNKKKKHEAQGVALVTQLQCIAVQRPGAPLAEFDAWTDKLLKWLKDKLFADSVRCVPRCRGVHGPSCDTACTVSSN